MVATSESETLKIGYGTSDYAKMRPMAFNNPIYVDIDGHGFQANGDTLGFELPAVGINADNARDQLVRAGLMKPEMKPQEPKDELKKDEPKKEEAKPATPGKPAK